MLYVNDWNRKLLLFFTLNTATKPQVVHFCNRIFHSVSFWQELKRFLYDTAFTQYLVITLILDALYNNRKQHNGRLAGSGWISSCTSDIRKFPGSFNSTKSNLTTYNMHQHRKQQCGPKPVAYWMHRCHVTLQCCLKSNTIIFSRLITTDICIENWKCWKCHITIARWYECQY
jgi:hypothetical protein